MPRLLAALAALAFSLPAHAQPPQTVAEKSDYKATSKSADVIAFCEAVAKRSPNAKLDYFGTTHEGRKLPYLVIANPPVADAAAARQSGKLVVMAFANIHAGEVDGKEALLALARELTDQKSHPLLDNLVILLVPNLNADGNDRIDPKNRPRENGPVEGAGTRANAQGLDLNRDFVKLESPEIRALVRLVTEWDPAVIIDCHTTNGSKHRFTLTYDGPRYPSDTDSAKWSNTTLFPAVAEKVKKATNFDIAPYGNFDETRTKWETYPASPRYSIQYFALRGKLGILSESYSYASFKDRVAASKAFVTACFEVVAEKRKDVAKLTAPSEAKRVALRTETKAFPEKLKVLGFEEVPKDGKRVATDTHKTYSLDYIGNVVPKELAELPYAYLVPATEVKAIEALQRHGIVVEELREDVELGTTGFAVTAVDGVRTGTVWQYTVTGKWDATAPYPVPAGAVVVKTGQPLGALAAYLLEPRSEDGLATWGLYSAPPSLTRPIPVVKLTKPVPLSLVPVRPLPEARGEPKPITDALLFSRGGAFSFGFSGPPLTTGAWLDGEHFLQIKEGKLLKVEARTGKGEPFADADKIKKSLLASKIVPEAVAEKLSKANAFRTSPDRSAFLFDIGDDIGLAYFDGTPAVRLTKSPGNKEFVTFAPDGKRIAFVRGQNLFAVDVATQTEKQLTTDGGKDIFNARGDWVYEEEIFNRDGKAYWWSPDGTKIAYLRFDDTPVKKFNIVELKQPQGRLESYAYPKPGDPNPLVKIGVVDADGGKPTFLDMGDYKPEDTLISRVGWKPQSDTVYAYVQNRTQTWLDMVVWDKVGAKPQKLFREITKAWVDDPGEPRWLADGSFLFPSERTGWKHLYRYAADGKLLAAVTKGEWEVKEVLRVDEDDKRVYFTAAVTSPTGTDFCRVALDGAGETDRITEKGKSHRVSLAPKGPLYIDRFSDPMTPTRANVCAIDKGEVRKLDTNPVFEREGFKFGKYERVKIPLKDGFVLEGALTYPPNFDPAKKYPVWLFTYAGPHTPTLRDEFGGGRLQEQSLANSGIICFNVDPRSASGKGAISAWTCYKQLGVQELKDLEEAVAWLAEKPYIDKTRVGISGHSYGGFMAAYALTHSKTFSAGIASAAVTDWKLYDTIYTERYMLTPKENPDGYTKSSCVAAAKNLSGKLLIAHGLMDDNVHAQNSVQFIDALQKANKDFELMFYPDSRHGIGTRADGYGPHFTRLKLDFIRRTMGVK